MKMAEILAKFFFSSGGGEGGGLLMNQDTVKVRTKNKKKKANIQFPWQKDFILAFHPGDISVVALYLRNWI